MLWNLRLFKHIAFAVECPHCEFAGSHYWITPRTVWHLITRRLKCIICLRLPNARKES